MHDNNTRYLDYLPAIYQEDEFLRGFLEPFEDVLQGFSELLSDIDRYFAPAFTDADFLPWLATWVALLLDEEWDEAKRRELIGEAVKLYRSRGTVAGLKQYLEIYTGYEPEIREWRWPGGMQVGVASQIGGPAAGTHGLPARIPVPEDPNEPGGVTRETSIASFEASRERHNYYVVTEHKTEEGRAELTYYRADEVEKVERGEGSGEPYVEITKTGEPPVVIRHQPASVSRRDGLVDSLYTIGLEVEAEPQPEYSYQGNTFLVDEVAEQPFRFIVDVRVPSSKIVDKHEIEKIRAIVDLEKPAHTMYYLKVTPVASIFELVPMLIGIRGRSEIGLHSVTG